MTLSKFNISAILVIVDVDDATLAEACGAKVIYRKNGLAIVDKHNPVLKNLKYIYKL